MKSFQFLKLIRRQKINYNYTSLYLKNFSSLGSPMFPTAQIPDIPHEINHTKDKTTFMSKNGGKIAIAVLSLCSYLLYSFFRGTNNKTKVEDDVLLLDKIEPYEINEFRKSNIIFQINQDEFMEIFTQSSTILIL
jgi:hypothetical protein